MCVCLCVILVDSYVLVSLSLISDVIYVLEFTYPFVGGDELIDCFL